MTTPTTTTAATPSGTPSIPPVDPTATPHQTLQDFAGIAGRGFTVVRNNFVQIHRGGKYVGSSLGRLVHARRHRALLAYLLLLMVVQALGRRPKPLEAKVWARALSPDPPDKPWPETAMTPIWSMLEEPPHTLITRERKARLVQLAPNKESGRSPYTRPRPDERPSDIAERYFILPDAFWLDSWHNKLSLPGLAMLLILLAGTTARTEAWLSPERADDWYGIAPKTMYNGLEDLRNHGLLAARDEWVTAGLSGIGRTKRTYYSLRTPFSQPEREALQETARVAAKQRVAASKRAAQETSPAASAAAPAEQAG